MEKTKAFLEAHYKRYILTICLLWFLMFFLPWDWYIGGVSIYYFVMKNYISNYFNKEEKRTRS